MDVLWRWLRPGHSADEVSEGSSDMPGQTAGRGVGDSRLDQLTLQAYAYAKTHPEFLQELDNAGHADQETGGGLPTAVGLRRQMERRLSVPLGTAPTNKAPAVMARGQLPAEWLDEAALPPVLDWPAEEEHRQLARRLRRQRQAPRMQMWARQQPATQQGAPDPVEEMTSENYEMHAAALHFWESASMIGRHPLPRRAPRARLCVQHDRDRPAKLPSWLASSSPGLKQTGVGHMAWKLPWLA